MRRMRRLSLVVMGFIFVAISALPSLAVPGDAYVRDLAAGTTFTLAELGGRFRLYEARAAEKPDDELAQGAFEKFVRSKFVIERLSPDRVSYDFVSDTLNITLDFPLEVVRRRGRELSTRTLYLVVPLERRKARAVMEAREGLYLRVLFHLNRNGQMVFTDLRVIFRGEQLYQD